MAIMEVLLNPGDTGAEVGALHEQLRNVGAVLDAGEQDTLKAGRAGHAARPLGAETRVGPTIV